jgi:hypothetical protein
MEEEHASHYEAQLSPWLILIPGDNWINPCKVGLSNQIIGLLTLTCSQVSFTVPARISKEAFQWKETQKEKEKTHPPSRQSVPNNSGRRSADPLCCQHQLKS